MILSINLNNSLDLSSYPSSLNCPSFLHL
jgi:hypothetical protein